MTKALVASAKAARKRAPDVLHKLVNHHPAEGWGALYLDPGTTAGVEGLSDAEGPAFLQELAEHATQPPFVYRPRMAHGRSGHVGQWLSPCTAAACSTRNGRGS